MIQTADIYVFATSIHKQWAAESDHNVFLTTKPTSLYLQILNPVNCKLKFMGELMTTKARIREKL